MLQLLPPAVSPYDAKIADGTQWDFYHATRGMFAGETPKLGTIQVFAVLVGTGSTQGVTKHLYGVRE